MERRKEVTVTIYLSQAEEALLERYAKEHRKWRKEIARQKKRKCLKWNDYTVENVLELYISLMLETMVANRSIRAVREFLEMKKYDVYYAGGEKITSIYAACISKACKSFIETLSKSAGYVINSKELADIRYTDNFSICCDFVVMHI